MINRYKYFWSSGSKWYGYNVRSDMALILIYDFRWGKIRKNAIEIQKSRFRYSHCWCCLYKHTLQSFHLPRGSYDSLRLLLNDVRIKTKQSQKKRQKKYRKYVYDVRIVRVTSIQTFTAIHQVRTSCHSLWLLWKISVYFFCLVQTGKIGHLIRVNSL